MGYVKIHFWKCAKIILLIIICFCAFLIMGRIFYKNKNEQDSTVVQEKSGMSLLHEVMAGFEMPAPLFDIFDLGAKEVLDYTNFGEFQNVGTPEYHYKIEDKAGLKEYVGSGIFPNTLGILKDENYQKFKKDGMLKIPHWDVLKTNEVQRAFYVWTQAPEEAGVKLFFIASLLERAGHILQAIKAYNAVVVHYPRSVCWAADKSYVWYVGPAAIYAIKRLTRDYPNLNLELVDAQIKIQNGNDTILKNDIITVNPGRIISKTLRQKLSGLPSLDALAVKQKRGEGRVQLIQYSNGHWRMFVEGKPYFIKGMTYGPTQIGLGPHNDDLFYDRWMFSDNNHNHLIDAPLEAWVDSNNNGRQDTDEASVGDFQLLKDMGVNTLRFLIPTIDNTRYDPKTINKPLLRKLFREYGIRLACMDFLGAYTIGSGASWEAGTDYTDPEQRRKMKELVLAKVKDLKDEPFVLMWIIGNGNNMRANYMGVNATRTNASIYPKEYAEFLNEVAEAIHKIDPHHPVAVGNVELDLLEYYRDFAPALDIVGINSYRGEFGFGNLWTEAKAKFDRPILITEYGCDAYRYSDGEDEESQMQYHVGNFRDIVFHQAGGPYEGNSIGGMIFSYLDEWWKDTTGDPEDVHQIKPQGQVPFPDGYAHEEWYGVASQGSGKNSPFERRLRKVYYFYKAILTE